MIRRRNERGMVTAFVAILAAGLLFMAGLIYDGGEILSTYRQAGDLAGNAARAAAQGVAPESLRAGTVHLNAADAAARAHEFLAEAGHSGSGRVSVEGDRVTVTVTLTAQVHILPIGSRRVSASASATPTRGVEQPSGGP